MKVYNYYLPLVAYPSPFHPLPEWFFPGVIEDTNKIPLKCWQAGLDSMKSFNQLQELKDFFSTVEIPYLVIYSDLDFIVWDAEKGGAESLFLNVPNLAMVNFIKWVMHLIGRFQMKSLRSLEYSSRSQK